MTGKFSRIKGANSDYAYSPTAGSIVEDKTGEVFLHIFVCPYGMPSRVDQVQEPPFLTEEQTVHACDGTSDHCPQPDLFPDQPFTGGHARITLHQREGISLTTDTNQVVIGQQGPIKLLAEAGVELNGDLKVNLAGASNVQLHISRTNVSITAAGATVAIDERGSIQLTPGPQSLVNVTGGLAVSSTITSPTITALTTELNNLKAELARLNTELAAIKQKLQG